MNPANQNHLLQPAQSQSHKAPNHNALHSYTQGSFEKLQQFYATNTSKTRFLNTLFQFLKHKGDDKVFNQVPMLGGNYVDFFNLYRTTERHGGYEVVSKRRLWGNIAKEMNIITYMDGACNPLKRWYETFLRSFEEVIRVKVAKHQSEKNAAAAAAAAAAGGGGGAPSAGISTSQSLPLSSGNAQNNPLAKRPRVDPVPNPLAQQIPSTGSFIPVHEDRRIPQRVSVDKISVDNAIKNIRSKRVEDVVKGLNFLNQASMEPDQVQLSSSRIPFYVDKHPLLILALGELLDTLNPFVDVFFPPTDYTTTLLDESERYCWKSSNPVDDNDSVKVSFFQELDNNKLYMAALNAIRNITFEITNIQLVSYSAPIMRHVTALLLVSSPSSSMMLEASSFALDILFHIGTQADTTGTRRMKKSLSDCWAANPFLNAGVDSSKDAYTQATAHLFPVLLRWLRCSDRNIVHRVVRVIGRLASVPENVVALEQMCPDEDLSFLVQLLSVSETSVEALHTPGSRTAQLPASLLAAPYKEPSRLNASIAEDFSDFSDVELRDAVLDTLSVMCAAPASSLKFRIASQPRCIFLLARIALRSCKRPRSDGVSKEAVVLLSSLATDPRNRHAFLPVVSSLSKAALSDDSVAEMMASPSMRALMQPLPGPPLVTAHPPPH